MTKNRRGGFYWHPETDKPYISVTNVLRATIDKPALRYWFGRKVYYAMAKDPGIDEKTALNAPYKSSSKAKDRGSTIHSLIEAHKNGSPRIKPGTEELQGYAKAFYDWFEDINPEVLENEKTVYADIGFAGTIDMVARIGGKVYVIDFKTSKGGQVYDEAHLQVSAYKYALGTDAGMIVALSEEGKYTQVQARDGFGAFKHALGLYKFLNEEQLKEVGYDF